MEIEWLTLCLGLLLWVAWLISLNRRHHRRLSELGRMPPGPRGWPVVGNMFQLGWAPHESLARLSQHHGPIMSLWLGSMRTVVISSSEAARDMFKYHDSALAGRQVYKAIRGRGRNGNEGSMVTAQHGPAWRTLRRLCVTEFFLASSLDSTQATRRHCVDAMVQLVEEAAMRSTVPTAVDIGKCAFLMAFNLIGNLVLSKDLSDPSCERGAKFFYHVGKAGELAGKPNVSDFFPILRGLDLQGIRRKALFHVEKAFEIVVSFVEERMETKKNGSDEEKRRDYLDALLEFRGDVVEEPGHRFSSRTINNIVLEMFGAGTETTTSTLEWAMAELLRNPNKLHEVQAELRKVAGPKKKVEESDIENLPYLTAVVKETLRLHPPLPLLVPHKAMQSCTMQGYYIPEDTQVLVNIWAIGRDPMIWEDPLKFKPERFLGLNAVDFKGRHFEFIPFGSGRRMCPAVPLVSRVLPLALGSLLLPFDWVLADGNRPQEMDMRDRLGMTLRKAIPLRAIPVPHKDYQIKGVNP